jgi:glutathione peroxidase
MAGYKDRVLLLVNTATKCGLAPQFKELEALHQEYKDRGLVVIGFPCNQFADQEPETNESMAQACELNFGVTFTLSEKIIVNGPDTHPIFAYLKSHSKSLLGRDIKWNFTKFLVSRDGQTITRYAPTTSPSALRPDIERLLSQ